ncbi:g1 s-specific cyclin [Grosmannia clavigera kw1407]|uniref:G1 s-specific cyclin n=1 Tax=Grosmannia clavigera (strain kw1407 / UAMH 11150) TaxID=655863 RepID=F0XMZ2_GROCL|nr:g1 s-specific cyclin [Grosmannia clavigera kw1407]EFX00771.1 g1 s-specific cyclin [Grosmannia clavigera kw1407]
MAYSTQMHDGTFFVESNEPTAPRMSAREAAKLLARNRQDMIANELSRLTSEEYLEDIMRHARHMEDETLPDVNLIDMQREIQWFMRPYLIDFIVEAHAAFTLLPETLFLTINLLDRYCSKRVVYKQHYQLVGCAALLIASKYGDKKDRVPQINELNNMCCGLYDAGMFTQMEMHVLNTLEWNIGHPTVDFFSQLIVAEERDDCEVESMAAYISEIALYHRDFVSTKPSTMARASLALARAILGRPEVNDGEWDHADNITLLTLSQNLHQPSPTLSRKYASSHFSGVSAKLTEFLARHAAAINNNNRRLADSCRSTSPCESDSVAHQADVYSTPHKGMGAVAGVADGYMTPPITPDGAYFAANGAVAKDGYAVVPRCPVTPTPPSNTNANAPSVYAAHAQQQDASVAQYAAYFDAAQ